MRRKYNLDKGPFTPLVRVFLAVHIPPAQQERASAIINTLSAVNAKVSWTKPQSLHITLKFLGEIPRDDINDVREALNPVLAGVANFDIAIKGLGCFPASGPPRVVWLGIEEGAEPLAQIARDIDKALTGIGFSPESRPWQPHITLGRVHSGYRVAELISAMSTASTDDMATFKADAVFLMRSQLGRGTPVYTEIAVWELGD